MIYNLPRSGKKVVGVPTWDGSLIYTGAAQAPAWVGYDNSVMTVSGATSGINAGTYQTIFALRDPNRCRWSDGTSDAKAIAWSINKAPGSLSISPSIITLNASKPSETIAVTRLGDGAISATSYDAKLVNTSISDAIITATGVNEAGGTTHIRIDVAEGTNYTAAESQFCSVIVTFTPIASTKALSGISYISGLSGLSASEITAFAKAISNNSLITNSTSVVYIDFNDVHRKVSVGDQVTLPLDGANYAFDVIGFNHDTLTSPTAYGAMAKTGRAGITFQMHDLFGTPFAMNDDRTNAGGWRSSKMRTSTMVTMLGYLPSAWQTAIKPVNKLSGIGGGASSGTQVVSDNCFLLAEGEIFGPGYGYSGNGYSFDDECANVTQYAYYKAGNSKIKYKNGSAGYWLERSPYSGNGGRFGGVDTRGTASYCYAWHTINIAFGFCV